MNTEEAEPQVEEESSAPVTTETEAPAGEADVAVSATASPSAPAASVYDAFRSLPQFQGQDDRAIASRLYEALQREQSATQALQQYQSVIPYASEYLSNKPLFEEWKNSRMQQQAPAPQAAPTQAQQESPWWNPPKVRDAYLQYLTRDENGREAIDPNAPLEAKHALLELQAYKADFAKKFLTDPQAALGPMVEKVAQQKAAEIVESQISRMQQEQYIANLERENADWLFDEKGNVSREGLAVQKYVEDAKQLGIAGPEARWNYAVAMVERDLLNLTMQQQSQRPAAPAAPVAQAPSPQETLAQRNMEYLRQQASRTPSQTTPTTTDQRVPQPAMTFAQRLAQQLSSDGLTS